MEGQSLVLICSMFMSQSKRQSCYKNTKEHQHSYSCQQNINCVNKFYILDSSCLLVQGQQI